MNAAAAWLPKVKVCYDRFHVARQLGEAVNTARKQKHRSLLKEGDRALAGTKYLRLEGPRRMGRERRKLLSLLRDACVRTGRAWALKEMASRPRNYTHKGWARKGWMVRLALASRSKLAPMVKAARMVRKHLEGILNAVVLQTTIGAAGSMNARIKRIKTMACGYRNRYRFRNAILFHLGGSDLYPKAALTYTDS